MSNSFLRNDGTFQQVDYASVTGTPSTSANPILTSLTNFTTADIALTSSSTTVFFTGPVVTQGSSGVWFASGTVTFTNPSAVAGVFAKLWDGTTVMASAASHVKAAASADAIAVSGVITSPTSNIKISVSSGSSLTVLATNFSGGGQDCTITAVRIG